VSAEASAIELLEHFASEYSDGQLAVRRAAVRSDTRQDGEPVTRILLVLSDPADDTWEVDHIRDLRVALGRRATELELPPVSLTLVAENEPEAIEAFAP